MRSIKLSVQRLGIGLHIKLPLKWREHPFVFGRFTIESKEQLQIIRSLPLQYVLYYPDKSSAEPLSMQDALSADNKVDQEAVAKLQEKMKLEKDQRIDQLHTIRRRIRHCEKQYSQSLSQLRSAFTKAKNRPEAAEDEIEVLVDSMLSLADSESLTLHLMDSPVYDQDHYFHILNVTVLSLLLAKARGYEDDKLRKLVLGASLHDIGKIRIPQAIRSKNAPLSKPEENYLRQHTTYGVKLVENFRNCCPEILDIVENHHEFTDGSGYPKGVQGSDVSEISQIVAMANLYDDLCHSRFGSSARTPYAAVSHMFRALKSKFNPDLLALFVKLVGIYPPGTVVQLSDDTFGMVLSNNGQHLLKPNVMIYDNSVPREQAPIIELKDSKLEITKVLRPQSLPQAIFDYLNPRTSFSYFFDADK